MLANKLAVANAFTADLDTSVEVAAYAGDWAAGVARDMLATVTQHTNPDTFYQVRSDHRALVTARGRTAPRATSSPSPTSSTVD